MDDHLSKEQRVTRDQKVMLRSLALGAGLAIGALALGVMAVGALFMAMQPWAGSRWEDRGRRQADVKD